MLHEERTSTFWAGHTPSYIQHGHHWHCQDGESAASPFWLRDLISIWPRSLLNHAIWSWKNGLGSGQASIYKMKRHSFLPSDWECGQSLQARLWLCKDVSRQWQTNSFTFQPFRTPIPKTQWEMLFFSFLLHSNLTASHMNNTFLSAHVNPPPGKSGGHEMSYQQGHRSCCTLTFSNQDSSCAVHLKQPG